jgi:hypothetical protein
MAIPDFEESGDLPIGVHQATIEEVAVRFGAGSVQRGSVTKRLLNVYRLAEATGMVGRFVVFGSYVSDAVEPNDVDIFLVMAENFDWQGCDNQTQAVFVHRRADAELGASVFWIKGSAVLGMGIDRFIEQWQIKRDQTRRGIIEVVL